VPGYTRKSHDNRDGQVPELKECRPARDLKPAALGANQVVV
jgi:hypothetical protein